jgi:hypothetical protein
MFAFITRRRRAEDARVARFLHAIALSDRYAVDPDWELRTVPDAPRGWLSDPTDTVQFPRIVLTAGAQL